MVTWFSQISHVERSSRECRKSFVFALVFYNHITELVLTLSSNVGNKIRTNHTCPQTILPRSASAAYTLVHWILSINQPTNQFLINLYLHSLLLKIRSYNNINIKSENQRVQAAWSNLMWLSVSFAIGQRDYFVFVLRYSIENSSVVLYRISLLWKFFDECLRDRLRKIAK